MWTWLASAPSTVGGVDLQNLLTPILSTGVVGVVLIMLIFEVGVVTKKSLDRMETSHGQELSAKDKIIEGQAADIIELKAANQGLQDLTRDKMIPALVQATEVSRAYVAELARERRA